MFTSSFAWTPSPASVAITSFAFMFDEVPEPVWNTSIGNWSSSSPAAMRSPAAAMSSALSASSRPSSAFTRAAAALIRPSQCATATGIGSPETGKLATALVVSPPQSSCRSAVSLTAAESSEGRSARRRAGGLEQLVPRAELDARAAGGLARRALGRVDRLPARVEDVIDAALAQELLEVVSRDGAERARAGVFEQVLDRLGRILLVRPDHAARPALDPSRDVQAGTHAAALVRDRAPALVERDARELDAAIADAPED